jgi:tyrosine-protein kinase Etk/Wzc
MNMNNSGDYPSGYQNVPEQEDLDLRRYFGLFLSNWYWFALSFFIAGMLSWGINNYSERVFSMSSSLLIKDETNSDLTGLNKISQGTDIFKNQQNLQNEIGILKSFNVSYRVMKELPEFHITIVKIGRRGIAQQREYKSAPFIVAIDTLVDHTRNSPVTLRLKSPDSYSLQIEGYVTKKTEYQFGELFDEAGYRFRILKRDSSKFRYDSNLANRYLFWFNRTEALANEYRSKLSISPVNEDASLVTLSTTGVSPQQEADYLNKLMDVYIRQGMEHKNQTATNTIAFIDKQLGVISDSLTKTEDQMENFKKSTRLFDLSTEGAIIKNKLEKFIQEKAEINLREKYYEYLAEYISSKNESGDIVSPSVMGVSDQMLISLVDQLAGLQAQKKQLKYNYTKDQPVFSLADSKIDDARKALSENVKSSIINVKRDLDDVNSRISSVEQDLKKLPETERRLINIQRQFDLNNTVYTYMLEKRSEAEIAKASKVSDNRIIDPAIPYNSGLIKPKTRKNYMFALILGLLIPGIYIFLVDQLHNKIIDKKDIEKFTNVPIIGFVGHNTYKSETPVIEKPGSSLAESFRTIRTNLKYYTEGKGKAIISITSTISGEGKTFISLNLASIIAMLGKKTLLVGVDLRKPRLDRILNTNHSEGLSSFLIGESAFSDNIIETRVKNLYFMPSGTVPPNPSELLESDRMTEFLKKAREEFDYIILDTPPVGIVSDAILLGSFADINIFVIRQRYSFKNTLELIQNISNRQELKNLTIAVNDIHISGYYGYGLRYGYGFYEGYGYRYGYSQYGTYGYGKDYYKYYTED